MTDKKLDISMKERDYRFAYAGFFIRLVAFIIDTIVARAIFIIVRALVPIDFSLRLFSFSIANLVELAIVLLYFSLMTYFNKGRSLGKMFTGLRVVSLSSDKLSFSQVFLREVCGRYVQNKFFILYLFVGFTPKKQSIFDVLLDTTVVKEDIYLSLYAKEV